MFDSDYEDRKMKKNGIIGAIVGDITGSRFEFRNHKSKEFDLFVSCPLEGSVDDGTLGVMVNSSSFTDDSVMTLAVADALLRWKEIGNGKYRELSMLTEEAMRRFGRKYPFAGYGGAFKIWLQDETMGPYNSWGNGSAMRVSPCGWAASSLGEALSLSDAVTCVTHNHPEGMKGARAVAALVYLAQTGMLMEELRCYAENNFYKLDFTLDEIRQSYEFDVSCQGSVPQALEAFFESTSYEDAIRNAVSIGGDSDTIAAIAGAVAGAYYGVPSDICKKAIDFLDPFLKKTLSLVM